MYDVAHTPFVSAHHPVQTMECLLRSHEVRAERISTLVSPSSQGAQHHHHQKDGSSQGSPKRQRMEQEKGQDPTTAGKAGDTAGEGELGVKEQVQGAGQENAPSSQDRPGPKAGNTLGWQQQASTLVSSCPSQAARGHTGYLTFARKWV